MTLDVTNRRRHARHLLLPEIGETGQEQLGATTAFAAAGADARAESSARDYLERAGVSWAPGADRTCAVPSAELVARVAGRADLEEAAALLLGALAAVETIKAVTGAGTARSPHEIASLTLVEDPA